MNTHSVKSLVFMEGKRITAHRKATVLYSNTKHIQQFQTVAMTCYTLKLFGMKFDVSGKTVALENNRIINTCKRFQVFTEPNINAVFQNMIPCNVTASHLRRDSS